MEMTLISTDGHDVPLSAVEVAECGSLQRWVAEHDGVPETALRMRVPFTLAQLLTWKSGPKIGRSNRELWLWKSEHRRPNHNVVGIKVSPQTPSADTRH